MQSLGRTLRKIGETYQGRDGGPARRGVLYVAPRPRLAGPVDRAYDSWVAPYLPNHAGLLATAGLLAASLVYGCIVGEHFSDVRTGAVRATGELAALGGLGISSVQITGSQETSEDQIVEALDLGTQPSLLTFDPFAARERLLGLSWVREATVQKLYPNTLRVEITEAKAFALWQIGGIVSIVDREGQAIEELTEPRFAGLPLLVGYGANRHAAELMDVVRAHPQISARFRAAVRIADRRWNVRLDNGVEVKLPETDAAGAIAELAEMDRDHSILSRDVAVDLRSEDRVVVTLTEPAATQRQADFKGAAKKRKEGRT